ncbi:MAG TPA: 7-carboxy-7-deazaguanine synthase [Burkholderiales bacterium]
MYQIKEIFYSLQGEGMNAGRPAVFCRFAGCNLWSGREKDRPDAVCRFCDTDFVGTDGTHGGKYASAAELAEAIGREWHAGEAARKFVVLTGGEPALQADAPFIDALHQQGFLVAIETNGTLDLPAGIDWICVSPKAEAPLKVRGGNELKLVYPQAGASPADYEHLAFENFLLQPMAGPDIHANTGSAVASCMQHPKWRLSLQTHKVLGIR